jgi:hypothetical protein
VIKRAERDAAAVKANRKRLAELGIETSGTAGAFDLATEQ